LNQITAHTSIPPTRMLMENARDVSLLTGTS
jgi:hypothetical protein